MAAKPKNQKIVKDKDMKKASGGMASVNVSGFANRQKLDGKLGAPSVQNDQQMGGIAAGATKVVALSEVAPRQVEAHQEKPDPWKDGGPVIIG